MEQKVSRRNFTKGMALLPLVPLVSRSLPGTNAIAPNQETTNPPNVLVVVFDTLSAHHMSLYGYPRPTTPNLERFAERATVYHSHYAAGNFTTPGTASLLTGTYPWTHRAFNHAGTVTQAYEDQNLFSAFPADTYQRIAYTHNLLANALLHQFHKHIDVHVNPSALCLADGSFADRVFTQDALIASKSFDELILQRGEIPSSLFLSLVDRVRMRVQKRAATQEYAESYPRGVPELFKLSFVLEQVIDGLQRILNAAQDPFLAYFHLLPPHEPYHPHKDYIGIFNDSWAPPDKEEGPFSMGIDEHELLRMRLQYDEFLAYADAEFGRLFTYLEQSGRLDDTIVVFTSDHGQLFERGIHGHVTPTLWDPVVRVPLLISLPGQQARQDIYDPTNCVDLLPTLLSLTGNDVPDWCEGSELPGVTETDTRDERSIYAMEAKSNLKYEPIENATVTLRQGQYKLTYYGNYSKYSKEYELYDMLNDPEELEDLYDSGLAVASELSDQLAETLQQVNREYS